MNRQTESVLFEVCNQLTADAAMALRAQRVSSRMRRLAETPPVLSAEQAEWCDLNRMVSDVVAEAGPLCQAVGAQVKLRRDPRKPIVPMLIRPIEDALAAGLDICLQMEGSAPKIEVETLIAGDRAVVLISGKSSQPAFANGYWQRADTTGQVELIIGDRAIRALGGRLQMENRGNQIRLRMDLPIAERPSRSWLEHLGHRRKPPRMRHHYDFPSVPNIPITGLATA